MKAIRNFEPGCTYLFRSLSSGNTSYFESEIELNQFNKLFVHYLRKYIKIIKTTVDQEGYIFLVKVKGKRTLISNYVKERLKSGKEIKESHLNEPWRIISEKIRLVHSLFVRFVNKLRKRSGVLVKKSHEKFYFENEEEALEYINQESDVEVKSQNNRKYQSIKSHCRIKAWSKINAKFMGQIVGYHRLTELVLLKIIRRTISTHLPSNILFQSHH